MPHIRHFLILILYYTFIYWNRIPISDFNEQYCFVDRVKAFKGKTPMLTKPLSPKTNCGIFYFYFCDHSKAIFHLYYNAFLLLC